MPLDDILLIQGPPGTGKTHTITGIISMLIKAGVRKIHVCAPSNTAVDEILTRMSKGLMGCEKDVDMKEMLLRMASPNYETSLIVKQYELEERLRKYL
jgi:superfamily I DNA and/or RNA helicase